MNDDTLIRRENLKLLCAARGWTPRDLHLRLGGQYSYARDLLADPLKSFGEKAARRIEEVLQLPRLWLDQTQPVPPPLHANEQAGTYSVGPADWPFSRELLSAVAALTPAQLARAEALLRAHLGLPPRRPT